MRKGYTRVYAEIDLDAVVFNMKSMKKNLALETRLVGVVKADGYGHGAVPVARAIDPYVEAYAVATAEEGLLLRRHGIHKPILILGPVHKSHYERLIEQEIRPVIFTMEQASALSKEAVKLGKQVLKTTFAWIVGIASFIIIAVIGVDAVWVILGGIVIGIGYSCTKMKKQKQAENKAEEEGAGGKLS